MSIDPEKLIVLKAFYMGHAIAQRHTVKPTALAMVDAAIGHFRNSSGAAEKARLAFYHMLRAEILRHGGTPMEDRREAQRICHEIGSPLYEYFLAIENATQGKKRLEGIQEIYVVG